jgi:hypothetical protein
VQHLAVDGKARTFLQLDAGLFELCEGLVYILEEKSQMSEAGRPFRDINGPGRAVCRSEYFQHAAAGVEKGKVGPVGRCLAQMQAQAKQRAIKLDSTAILLTVMPTCSKDFSILKNLSFRRAA